MRTRQGFSKNVSKIVTARDEFDAQITTENTSSNIMIVYFNVLRPRMKHRVGSQGNCRIVVTQKNRNVGKRQTKFSEKRVRSQANLAAVDASARYSALVDERETVDCFLEDQEIGLEPRKTKMLVVDFLSDGSPAQFASEKAERVIGPGST